MYPYLPGFAQYYGYSGYPQAQQQQQQLNSLGTFGTSGTSSSSGTAGTSGAPSSALAQTQSTALMTSDADKVRRRTCDFHSMLLGQEGQGAKRR